MHLFEKKIERNFKMHNYIEKIPVTNDLSKKTKKSKTRKVKAGK